MSEPTTPSPPGDPPQDPPQEPPPPPAGDAPPAAAPPSPPPSAGQPNGLMIVLAYLWILALVPLLVEKDDEEVQWHAKHGLVLLVAEIIMWIALSIVSSIPLFGFIGCAIFPIVWLGTLILHIVCIVKGVGGSRFMIPGVSQYASKF